MVILLGVGFLAGVVTGLSPCALPVLPALAGGGASGGGKWRPLAIVAGMVATFSAATLVGSSLLSLVGLPQDLLRDLGIAVLFLLGAGLVYPPLGYLIERPFARLGPRREHRPSNGLVLGASLGLVFVPCAGPVLAAIAVVSAAHRVNLQAVLVTLSYALGAAIPLLLVAYLGRRAASGAKRLRRQAPLLRQAAGVLVIASAALVLSGAAQSLQQDLPAYANSLDGRIEASGTIATQLRKLDGEEALRAVAPSGRDLPDASNPVLTDYGASPRLLDITAWFNTKNDKPLKAADLKGKVVLIDFWTYSCINCERALPHLEAWYRQYSPYGLVIIGVHTPEFAFERVLGNVRHAVGALGVSYPVAVDNSYMTWLSFGNEQWPEEYLIDQTGQLRYVKQGEGGYYQTESLIRDLLGTDNQWLPPRTDVADLTPKEPTTPETDLGSFNLQLNAGPTVVYGKTQTFRFAAQIPMNYVSFAGTWSNNGNAAIARADAAVRLRFEAKDVYLVLGGSGKVRILFDGRRIGDVTVRGYPRNYAILTGDRVREGLLQLDATPGVAAYNFTFG